PPRMPPAARTGTPTPTSSTRLTPLSLHDALPISKPALERGEAVRIDIPVRNVHRTIGGMLAGEVARRFGQEGLPEGTIDLRFTGDRKSTRLNSSHRTISYAVFCLKTTISKEWIAN